MKPHYSKIHNSFKLNKKLSNLTSTAKTFEREIDNFLKLWQNSDSFIVISTSGSTGNPKDIKMNKQAMVNSAIATGTYFNLQPSDKTLLCLPVSYIAGKMMLVRAMVLGLEIDCIEPKSNLDIDETKEYHFAAMVPLQLQKNREKLSYIKHLIIGGAKVSKPLQDSIQSLPTNLYETYGMTETVSHIAIKQLNTFSKSSYFNVMPSITISQDDRDCLVIDALNISKERIITNDIVKLHSKAEFEWLGRYDNVINSGGIKIHPEQIENQLSAKIDHRFFIASEKEKTLGEQIIIVIEGRKDCINTSVFSKLKAHTKPRKIYYVDAFVETGSGKIQRKQTLDLLK